jgi:hypothetical protein
VIPEWIAWWRFTHPELFAGWVSLLLADMLCWVALLIMKASESASASKINSESFIEWKWET